MDAPVLVVGGGLAGLAAAVRLHRAGRRVLVFEPGVPGGKARTEHPGPGWTIEWGPHTFTHRAHALQAFLADLGLQGEVVKLGASARARFYVRDGRLCALPKELPPKVIFGLLSGLVRVVPPHPGESLREFFRRRFGAALAGAPLDALASGIWASDPGDLEAAAAMPNLVRALEAAPFPLAAAFSGERGAKAATFTVRGGLGRIAAAARAALPEAAWITETVTAVEAGRAGVAVTAGGARYHGVRVVLATEAFAAAKLLSGTAAGATLRGFSSAPLAVVHWTSPDAAYPAGFGFLAPPVERIPVLGTLFVSDLLPERAPPGQRAFTTMIGGGFDPAAAAEPDDALLARVREATRRLTGTIPTISASYVVRHRAAVATPSIGHARRVAAVKANLPTGVFVAGSWLGAGALHDAVGSGFAAADQVLA